MNWAAVCSAAGSEAGRGGRPHDSLGRPSLLGAIEALSNPLTQDRLFGLRNRVAARTAEIDQILEGLVRLAEVAQGITVQPLRQLDLPECQEDFGPDVKIEAVGLVGLGVITRIGSHVGDGPEVI